MSPILITIGSGFAIIVILLWQAVEWLARICALLKEIQLRVAVLEQVGHGIRRSVWAAKK